MVVYAEPTDEKLTKGMLENTPNHTVVQKISRPKELILLFWVDERNKGSLFYTDRDMFKAAADTRARNIEKSPWYIEDLHKIYKLPVLAIHDIGTRVYEIMNEHEGKAKIREVGIFSYCGLDGPISYHSTVYPPVDPLNAVNQMNISGWAAIKFNWIKEGAMCVLYGNQSAWYQNSFSEKLSRLENFKNVEVWGQTNFAYGSFFPDYRVSSTDRNVGIGWSYNPVYLVGGLSSEGWAATCIRLKSAANLTREELREFPKARPMLSYRNGSKIRKSHQGVFNDHRPHI